MGKLRWKRRAGGGYQLYDGAEEHRHGIAIIPTLRRGREHRRWELCIRNPTGWALQTTECHIAYYRRCADAKRAAIGFLAVFEAQGLREAFNRAAQYPNSLINLAECYEPSN